jgi:hypothetical protein
VGHGVLRETAMWARGKGAKPNSTQHHPTIIVARFNKTSTRQPTNIINNLTP